MALVAVVRLYDDLILFEETFGRDHDVTATFEDFHYLTDEDGFTRYVFFWWCTGSGFETFDAALQSDPTVVDARSLAEIPGRRLYRVDTTAFPPEQPLVFPVFRQYDITSLEAIRGWDGLTLRARFPSRDALRTFRDVATRIADNVDVEQLYTEQMSETARLTERQREAVTMAYERGYFDTPRRTTLSELADELEVTSQTLSRHVRVGVEKIVADALAAEPADGV
jgi:hypothetical protein